MRLFCRSSLIVLLLIIPTIGNAMTRLWDADVVITMRNGQPCFSYPQDKEIKKRPYSFSYLDVSKAGPVGGGGWEIQISSPDRKGLLDPNSPETCIQYGTHHPGTEDIQNAKPLQMDAPYVVFIRVNSTSDGPFYERKYLSGFCLARDENGNKIIVGTQYDSKADVIRCLKPGEKPKRGFWERLFGN